MFYVFAGTKEFNTLVDVNPKSRDIESLLNFTTNHGTVFGM